MRLLFAGGGLPRRVAEDILTDAEILRVTRVAARLGIRKLRLTGGEPILRPGLARLVEGLAALPGVEDLAPSTNGTRLAASAEGLRRAACAG